MKTTHFLILVAGIGALTLGRSFADEPSRLGLEHGVGVQPNRARSLLNANGHVPERSGPAHPSNVIHQPAFRKAATAANHVLMMNKTANRREQPPGLPVGRGTVTALSGVIRRGNAGAASLGGQTASSVRQSAVSLKGAD
jgi:hypothetical protein